MKSYFACALLLVALGAGFVHSKPWGGKTFTLNIQKNYDGPNLGDILSSVVRTKMALKKSIWDSLLAAKSKSYSYNYSYNYDPAPVVHKTRVTVHKEYVPVEPVKTSEIVIHKRIEVVTSPPPTTRATTTTTTTEKPYVPPAAPPAAVEHIKTFTFQSSWGAAASSGLASGSGSGSFSAAGNQSDDSELVDISELQRNHDEK